MNCPKCGAGVDHDGDTVVIFQCGRYVLKDNGETLTKNNDGCRIRELEKKLEELEEYHAWDMSPAMYEAKIDQSNKQLLERDARIKRLEEAGDCQMEVIRVACPKKTIDELEAAWTAAKEAQ